MPGRGLPQVKCEPTSESDDEESNSQFALQFTPKQVPSEVDFRSVKREPDSSVTTEDDVESSIMRNLQTPSTLEELAPLAPAAPAATPVCVKQEAPELADAPPASLETLEPAPYSSISHHMEHHMALMSEELPSEFMPLMAVKDEPMSEGEQPHLSGEDTSDSCAENISRGSPKSWSQQDMENALEALRSHNMSLTRASATFGIPSTTLWQRAHRLGIDTPKKEGGCKSWGEAELRAALRALRAGAISANKASKAYGIPSSTLYKIARREGIRLAAPFNAAPTSWRPADLEQALRSIRTGHNSVQRASAQYGIPTGTLYGRCKREGIELSRSNPTPWSEDAMGEALEAVRVGQMSINQAAIHYNLPYSSLYGRFKRCKYPQSALQLQQIPQECPEMNAQSQQNPEMYQQYHQHAITHPLHPDPIDHTNPIEHANPIDHANPVHYHHSPMQHMSEAQVSNQMHDPSMLSNVMFHEQGYAMHYNQGHNGVTAS